MRKARAPGRWMRRIVTTVRLGGTLFPALAVAAAAGCFSSEPDTTGLDDADVVVEMTGALTFAPAVVTIRAGETVRWDNVSSVPHTVTADPDEVADPDNVTLPAGAQPFASPLIAAGGSYARQFIVAGTYRYVCVPHEAAAMFGTVVVEP